VILLSVTVITALLSSLQARTATSRYRDPYPYPLLFTLPLQEYSIDICARAASPQHCPAPAPAPATLPRASAQAAAEAQMQGERAGVQRVPLSPRETCRLPKHNPITAAFFPRAVADLTLRSDTRRRVTRAASPQHCPAPAPAPATLPRASAQAAAEAQMQGERFFPRAIADLTHAALRHTRTGCERGPVLQPPPRTAPLPLSLR
jgi:hypothetical protein